MMHSIKIGNKIISEESPTFIVAELSGNHNMDFNRAIKLIELAKDAGADAVKLQTYTADTITIKCDNPCFQITQGTIWDGVTLYDLYKRAYTPWEWQSKLIEYAKELGLICFSSPFDPTAVDFLENLNVPVYKIASFEITDIPLIRKIARLGKPVIFATGIAGLEDISLAVETCRQEGNNQIVLLKCTSEYPAKAENMNLLTIQNLSSTFDCISGLSDHSMGSEIAVASVALGAKMIEKHITIRRSDGGCDSAFSMEANEFKEMCRQIRTVEQALGKVTYKLADDIGAERSFARSLFAVKDIQEGEVFSSENVRSIRPGNGLHPKYLDYIIGKKARITIKRGTPLQWKLINS